MFEEALSLCHSILAFHSNAKRETSENLPRCFKNGSYYQCLQIESFYLQCKLSLINFLCHEDSLFLELMIHHDRSPDMIVALTRLKDNYPEDPYPNSEDGAHYSFVPDDSMIKDVDKASKRKYFVKRLKFLRWLFRSLCQAFSLQSAGGVDIVNMDESQVPIDPELLVVLKSSFSLIQSFGDATVSSWLESLQNLQNMIESLSNSSFDVIIPHLSDALLFWISWMGGLFDKNEEMFSSDKRVISSYVNFLQYLRDVLDKMRDRIAAESVIDDMRLDEKLVAYAEENINIRVLLQESSLTSIDRMNTILKKKSEVLATLSNNLKEESHA